MGRQDDLFDRPATWAAGATPRRLLPAFWRALAVDLLCVLGFVAAVVAILALILVLESPEPRPDREQGADLRKLGLQLIRPPAEQIQRVIF